MVNECPRCSRSVPDDSIYCPYCGGGIAYQSKTPRVYVASFLLLALQIEDVRFGDDLLDALVVFDFRQLPEQLVDIIPATDLAFRGAIGLLHQQGSPNGAELRIGEKPLRAVQIDQQRQALDGAVEIPVGHHLVDFLKHGLSRSFHHAIRLAQLLVTDRQVVVDAACLPQRWRRPSREPGSHLRRHSPRPEPANLNAALHWTRWAVMLVREEFACTEFRLTACLLE